MFDEMEKTGPEETNEEVVQAEATETPQAEPVEAKATKKRGRPKKAQKAEEDKKSKQTLDQNVLQNKRIEHMDKVALFNQKYMRNDIPAFKAGDTLRVHYRIVEGDKTRTQVFEGVCIARKHGGLNETITVRKMSGSIGVERIFFLHSKRIEKIEVKKVGDVRRAKIYFLRGRTGKAARIREQSLH